MYDHGATIDSKLDSAYQTFLKLKTATQVTIDGYTVMVGVKGEKLYIIFDGQHRVFESPFHSDVVYWLENH